MLQKVMVFSIEGRSLRSKTGAHIRVYAGRVKKTIAIRADLSGNGRFIGKHLTLCASSKNDGGLSLNCHTHLLVRLFYFLHHSPSSTNEDGAK